MASRIPKPHPQAALSVLDDPLRVAQSYSTDVEFCGNVMIKGSLVCATRDRGATNPLNIVVFDWRTGGVIVSSSANLTIVSLLLPASFYT